MSSSAANGDFELNDHAPAPVTRSSSIHNTSISFACDGNASTQQPQPSQLLRPRVAFGNDGRRLRLNTSSDDFKKQFGSAAPNNWMGSYGHSPAHSRAHSRSGSPEGFRPGSPSMMLSQECIDRLLNDDEDVEFFNLNESRDGFFDAPFSRFQKCDEKDLLEMAKKTLPPSMRKPHAHSPTALLSNQLLAMKAVVISVCTTKAGVKLMKSFLAFFIAYILCLIHPIRTWLGEYNHIMVISTIINHPGRTIGAQIEGCILTIAGTALGLAWGALALEVSNSSSTAQDGYGGVLAAFFIIFMAGIATVRSSFIRSYQFALCAGIAVSYACLADTFKHSVDWYKFWEYGIPWLFGQAICLLICLFIFPETSGRPFAISLRRAFDVMQEALVLPQPDRAEIHRNLAREFVHLSTAYRDLVIEISIIRYRPKDAEMLRNLMQAVVRSLLALRMDNNLLGISLPVDTEENGSTVVEETIIDIDIRGASDGSSPDRRTTSESQLVDLVKKTLKNPTRDLLIQMQSGLTACDAALSQLSGYRKHIGPPKTVSDDVSHLLGTLQDAMKTFDSEHDKFIDDDMVPSNYDLHQEFADVFLFVNPIRQAASSIEKLMVKVQEMQQNQPGWRLYMPSYPWNKALQRANTQVRHDRGGLTAGFYFRSQRELQKMMNEVMQVGTYRPMPEGMDYGDPQQNLDGDHDVMLDRKTRRNRKDQFKFQIWKFMHRLQGFETRYAAKVVLVMALLSVPAWLGQSNKWWNKYEIWWVVVMAWIMMHPRVGGNFQDLIIRALCAVLGAVWGGLSYSAASGNPYIMALFSAIFMLPMIYRYTQSHHPRSGIVGCLTYTVVSLSKLSSHTSSSSTFTMAWTRGLSFVIGVISAIVVNWILWPFVARHELRKALSHMIMHSAIMYRGVVAKYIYYSFDEPPSAGDIARSEQLEGRLREGFVRIRQLMELTRHEIRLRGPFDVLPYSALIDACERFFEHLIEVRQSSLFFNPQFLTEDEAASEILFPFRRDAVASILMNLYVLSGALRTGGKVPRYLPSAAMARKRLLDKMAHVEDEHGGRGGGEQRAEGGEGKGPGGRWAAVYQYSYSTSLTDCVQQLELLQKYTKIVCGEQNFDIYMPRDR